MGRNKHKRLQYTAEDLVAAKKTVAEGISIRKAAKQYGVPISTLRHKIFHNQDTLNPFLKKAVLTNNEELALYNWIVTSAQRGYPRSASQIMEQAARIANHPNLERENKFPNGLPSKSWLFRFLHRMGILKGTKANYVSVATASVTEIGLRSYFNRIETYLKDNFMAHCMYYPHQIGNADETALPLVPHNTTVYVGNEKTHSQNIQTKLKTSNIKAKKVSHVDNKSNMTVNFTALADGTFLKPFILFPYERIPANVKESLSSCNNITYSKSTTGWMNQETFIQYLLEVVIPYVKSTKIIGYFILFVDGHKSHLSLEASELCMEHSIVLITLFPNSTFILQPLDVNVFGPLKAMWNAFLLRKDHNFEGCATKLNFGPILDSFVDQKKEPLKRFVQDGFQRTGIYPWNIDAVEFEKLLPECRQNKKVNTPDNNCVVIEFETGKQTFI